MEPSVSSKPLVVTPATAIALVAIIASSVISIALSCTRGRAATGHSTAAALFPPGSIATGIPSVSVVLFLALIDVSLSWAAKVQAVSTARMVFARITHPVCPIVGFLETSTCDLTSLPSVGASRHWTRCCAVLIVSMPTNFACSS
jgi:hypothetical protein